MCAVSLENRFRIRPENKKKTISSVTVKPYLERQVNQSLAASSVPQLPDTIPIHAHASLSMHTGERPSPQCAPKKLKNNAQRHSHVHLQMASLSKPPGQLASASISLCIIFLPNYLKQLNSILSSVCTGIDHRTRQNVVRTLMIHCCVSCATFLFNHLLTSY